MYVERRWQSNLGVSILVTTLIKGELVGYFTSVADDLNSGLSRKNPASGQGGTWTRDLRITSPAL